MSFYVERTFKVVCFVKLYCGVNQDVGFGGFGTIKI